MELATLRSQITIGFFMNSNNRIVSHTAGCHYIELNAVTKLVLKVNLLYGPVGDVLQKVKLTAVEDIVKTLAGKTKLALADTQSVTKKVYPDQPRICAKDPPKPPSTCQRQKTKNHTLLKPVVAKCSEPAVPVDKPTPKPKIVTPVAKDEKLTTKSNLAQQVKTKRSVEHPKSSQPKDTQSKDSKLLKESRTKASDKKGLKDSSNEPPLAQSKDSHKDISKDASKDASKDTLKDTSKESPVDTVPSSGRGTTLYSYINY